MNRPAPYKRPLLVALVVLALAGGAACWNSTHPGPGGVKVPNGPRKKDDVKNLALADELEVPYLRWGGDVATFLANGGETTHDGTAFRKQGLKLRLVDGNNFPAQVAKYKEGKTPFLRGTMSMLGQVSEDLAGDDRTLP